MNRPRIPQEELMVIVSAFLAMLGIVALSVAIMIVYGALQPNA
ncbi:hypothetical protein [Mycobacterium sp. 23]